LKTAGAGEHVLGCTQGEKKGDGTATRRNDPGACEKKKKKKKKKTGGGCGGVEEKGKRGCYKKTPTKKKRG